MLKKRGHPGVAGGIMKVILPQFLPCTKVPLHVGGTSIRELTKRLGDPPPTWIQKPLVVRDRDGRPQEDPLAVHCFCVCSRSALLGDLGVTRSMECDQIHGM